MGTEDLIADLKRLVGAEDPWLTAAYVFGSAGRGTMHADSDVDVGVLMRHPPRRKLQDEIASLEWRLERAVGRSVQVVVLNDAAPDLVHRVLRDGVLVLDRDKGRRIRFEVASRNRYFDIKPYLDRYRRSTEVSP